MEVSILHYKTRGKRVIYVLILGGFCLVVAIGVGGYFVGRFQTQLVDKIRTLEGKQREVPPEPEKPAVTGGAYQPGRAISTAIDKKRSAGLVETKTPQQLDWESQNELHNLETGA